MEVVGLYTWLSVHADRDGRVVMSLNEISRATHLSKMQVRRYLEKLRVTQLATQQATQPATQLPNVTTICFLSSCEQKKEKSDTACDTASDIGSDTPRANKNDNIIISCLKEEEKISSLRSEIQKNQSDGEDDVEQRFNEWMQNNFPFVCKMKRPLLLANYNSLLDKGYTNEQITGKLADMDNSAGIEKKYTNAYRTLLNWLKQDFKTKRT